MDHITQPLDTSSDLSTVPSPSLPPPTDTLYLIRLSQSHESFRLPELKSLASYFKVTLKIHFYSPTSPFCIVSFPPPSTSSKTPFPPSEPQPQSDTDTHTLATKFISRSILSKSISVLYAHAPNYLLLHSQIRSLPPSTWRDHEPEFISFKFNLDAFRGKRSMKDQREIVEGFSYLPFKGRIKMSGADVQWIVCEEWEGVMTAEEHEALRNGKGNVKESKLNGEDESRSKAISVSVPAISLGTTFTATTTTTPTPRHPKHIYFARLLTSNTSRHLIEKHDLKKRPYISTTSMDAELALITATLTHCGPGRLILDPFVGTGGFMVAAAELGAVTLGSDIDGRAFRGKGAGMKKGVLRNFERYGIVSGFGNCITSDLTNSPFRAGRGRRRWLDAIICDPPYGVREGLKVLGRRVVGPIGGEDGSSSPLSLVENGDIQHATTASTANPSEVRGPILINGVPSHLLPGFIAPKRPYSFDLMLGDILDFAARVLVDGGRLAFWMPCANEAEEEFAVPTDPKGLVILKHACVQVFNKWSRRLLVYERVPGEIIEEDELVSVVQRMNMNGGGHHADDLNQFRRMYFQGFRPDVETTNKAENG